MRYRTFGVFSGKKLLCLILLILLLPVALSSCARLFHKKSTSIAGNVLFEGKNVGGMTIEEAKIVVGQFAQVKKTEPQDAVIDSVTNGVIAGLNGVEVDTEKTLANLLAAKKGTSVNPVYRQVPPSLTLDDFKQHPIFQGNPSKQQVTFIINVAWGNEYLQEMMDVLNHANVEATFFLVGRWVHANQAEAKLIADAGYEIASHGYSDAISMQQAAREVIDADIAKAANVIETVCGKRPIYFSPHRGELSPLVLESAAAQNFRVVMWTIDTVDWKLPGVDVMVNKITNGAHGGSLILMHPTEQTAEFLRQVIPVLQSKGLEPVTLTELLSPERVLKE